MNCPIPVLEALVQAHPAALITADSRRGLYPIHLGLLKGTAGIEQIDYLLSVCPELALRADLDGNLPLHLAVEYASDDIIRRILSSCPEAAGYKTNRQRYVLHLLATSRCQIEGSSDNSFPEEFEVSLDTIKATIEAYSDALQQPDLQGRLPLHLAACTPYPRWDVLKLLCDAYPAALLVQDENHKLPLHLLKRFSTSTPSCYPVDSSLTSPPLIVCPDNDVILTFLHDRTVAEKRKNNVFHKLFGKVIPLKKKMSTASTIAAMPTQTLEWTNCYG
jgi:hypothetical protein